MLSLVFSPPEVKPLSTYRSAVVPFSIKFLNRINLSLLFLEIVLEEKVSEKAEEGHNVVKICHCDVCREFCASCHQ